MSRNTFYSLFFHAVVAVVAWMGLPKLFTPPPPNVIEVEVAIAGEAAPEAPALRIPAQPSETPQAPLPPERTPTPSSAPLPPAALPTRETRTSKDERPVKLAAVAPRPPVTPAKPPPRPEQQRAVPPATVAAPDLLPVPGEKPAPPAVPPQAKPPTAAAPPPKPADNVQPPPKAPSRRFDNMLRDIAETPPKPAPQQTEEGKLEKKEDDVVEQFAKIDLPIDEVPAKPPRANFTALIHQKIRNQIEENWARPPALQITGDLVVVLVLHLDLDGTIANVKIDQEAQERADKDPKFQPFVDSALLAVHKTRKIQGLPPNDYDLWQNVRLNFRPQS